jgi:signal transduction histidine kinase
MDGEPGQVTSPANDIKNLLGGLTTESSSDGPLPQFAAELLDLIAAPIVVFDNESHVVHRNAAAVRSGVALSGDDGQGDDVTREVPSLLARVAHELNNPLDGVMRYLNLAVRAMGDDCPPDVRRYLEEAQNGLSRMARISRDLLGYGRGSAAGEHLTSLNRVVEEAVRIMQDRAGECGVVISASYREENMPSVGGSQIFQVCCNLIKNALDAMPGGGMLTISTGVADGSVVLRFEDSGAGLPDEVDRIFEPFFTTKARGRGTGLGLAICKEYVEQFGGTITASRRDEGGSVFQIVIPLERFTADGSGAESN